MVSERGAAGDVIFYDGHCRLCTASAKQLERLLGGQGASLRSFREPGALERFPAVSLERCERALQLVTREGQVYEGAEAVVRAVARRRLGKIALLYYLPGLRQLADLAYRAIARYRFRIAGRTCQDGSCALHGE